MSKVTFENNTMKVIAAIDKAAIAFLYEAAGEIKSQTVKNMPTGGGYYNRQKEAWDFKVDESKGEAVIGNPIESMLWTEFGTGEYALEGNGRKGYWVYVKGSDGTKSTNHKTYTREEARKIVALMRKDGLDAHYTNGQKPKRPFGIAYNKLKKPLIKRANEILKERLK